MVVIKEAILQEYVRKREVEELEEIHQDKELLD